MDIFLAVIVIIVVAAAIFFRPTAYNVTRDIMIQKPLEDVFNQTLDLTRRDKWSPWLCMDPGSVVKVEGSGTRSGDIYSWESEYIGSGTMAIRAIQEKEGIDHELVFLKPFKSKASVRLEFKAIGDGAQVSWIMNGRIPAMMKSMMVGMIGMDFERGLSMLKQWLETGEVLTQSIPVGTTKRDAVFYVGRHAECSLDDIASSMENSMSALCSRMKENSIEASGAPFCIYRKYDITARTCEYVMAIPVRNQPSKGSLGSESSWETGQIPAHQAYLVKHVGSYKNLGNAWSTGFNRLRSLKLKPTKSMAPYEVYVDDPEKTPEAQLSTEIYWPLKA